VVFRFAIGAVDDVPHPEEPSDFAHSVEDPTIAFTDVAVFRRFAIRMGSKPADSLAAGTLHHGAILDHSIDRKSLHCGTAICFYSRVWSGAGRGSSRRSRFNRMQPDAGTLAVQEFDT
jgi:hypothetical protein